jgi:hypothetical protein
MFSQQIMICNCIEEHAVYNKGILFQCFVIKIPDTKCMQMDSLGPDELAQLKRYNKDLS